MEGGGGVQLRLTCEAGASLSLSAVEIHLGLKFLSCRKRNFHEVCCKKAKRLELDVEQVSTGTCGNKSFQISGGGFVRSVLEDLGKGRAQERAARKEGGGGLMWGMQKRTHTHWIGFKFCETKVCE